MSLLTVNGSERVASDQLMGTPQKTGPKDKGGAGSDDSLGQMIIDQIVGFGI